MKFCENLQKLKLEKKFKNKILQKNLRTKLCEEYQVRRSAKNFKNEVLQKNSRMKFCKNSQKIKYPLITTVIIYCIFNMYFYSQINLSNKVAKF